MIAAALSWEGTRFHHAQCAKGRGVDCVLSLIEWFAAADVIERFDPRPYPASWFLHQDEERYLNGIARYADRLPDGVDPKPADIALYRFGRCVAHGGLILDDDFIIHACAIAKRVERRERSAMLPRLHSYWRARGL